MDKMMTSMAELQREIALLKSRKAILETEIGQRFDGPGAIISTALTLVRGKHKDGKKDGLGAFLSDDIVSNLSRMIVPVLLNTLVFRKSGFITKALVTFFSQKAASKINTDALSGAVDGIKSLFNKVTGKRRPKSGIAVNDYGIPPDSETY